jgi:acyl-CoA reductase-like NAD-dependent aldehyde dehydrogenase
MTSTPVVSLYIGGKYRPASSNATFPVQNAFNGSTVTTSASASLKDCIDAIEAAHHALPAWESLGPYGRQSYFVRAAGIMDSEAWRSKVREALREETSSTSGWATFQGLRAGDYMRDVVGMVGKLRGETFQSVVPGGEVLVQRRAIGVV